MSRLDFSDLMTPSQAHNIKQWNPFTGVFHGFLSNFESGLKLQNFLSWNLSWDFWTKLITNKLSHRTMYVRMGCVIVLRWEERV